MLERTLNVVGIAVGIPALIMVFWDGYWITGALLSLGWLALIYRYVQTRPYSDDGWLTGWLLSAIFASNHVRLQVSRAMRARSR